MTRIITGTAGGRRVRTPSGGETRPTSERTKEGLFSRLDFLTDIEGSRVLDLYAGSGALGLECASRGANHVVCVEAARSASALIVANARELGLDQVHAVTAKVETWLGVVPEPGQPRFDIVIADPPYRLGEDELSRALALLDAGWVAPESIVVVERSRRSPSPSWPASWRALEPRQYGETTVYFAETAPDGQPESVTVADA